MRIWTVLCLLALAAPSQADTLFGIYAGYGTWHHDAAGNITAGTDPIDVEQDISLGDDQDDLYYIAVEHGLPFVPNVRAQHMSYSSNGVTEAGRTLEFNGLTFQPPNAVESDVFIEQTDLILYYEVLDNALSWDVGIGARQIDGSMKMGSTLARTTIKFDGTIPLLYTRFRMDLLGGWWASADAMGITYSGDELLDGSVMLGWESPYGLGLEAGFKWVRLRLDDLDDVTEASLDFVGPYAALNYHF